VAATRRRPTGRLAPLLLATALPVLPALAGCGPVDVTAARLAGSIAETFGNLYVRQQDLLGYGGLAPAAVAARATCAKPGATGPPRGAGEWQCTLQWSGGDGAARTATYEVQAKAGGCYLATGPAGVVGPPRVRDRSGAEVNNPVAAFDGCFDTFR
jgi:hypothetical protein